MFTQIKLVKPTYSNYVQVLITYKSGLVKRASVPLKDYTRVLESLADTGVSGVKIIS